MQQLNLISGCRQGHYGPRCQLVCDCENNAPCDPVTGQCRCVLGWTGPRCNVVKQGEIQILLTYFMHVR